ncbi:hypothetical protein FTV88_0096 [Heliorestis convoluta]|uniref:Uncharacterized protein n=1 Tax=Heliorestis convoluta TaxID=356322 RepID=A0A5Q2N153_9FIRM|nr:hypothetical protein FTV88_0096 [Heliorestis convoluta]
MQEMQPGLLVFVRRGILFLFWEKLLSGESDGKRAEKSMDDFFI